MKRLHLVISGQVQGVFFRDFAQKNSGNLKGWVKNTSTGAVEIIAEGEEEELKRLLEKCRQGPSAAKVEKIDEKWEKATNEFDSFEIKY